MEATAGITRTAWRYELKYSLPEDVRDAVEYLLHVSPLPLYSIYPDRDVHSIYYDDRSLGMYEDHVSGVSRRHKMRVRWYNDDPARAILECKERHELLGRKRKVALHEFDLEKALRQPLYPLLEQHPEMAAFLAEDSNRDPVAQISYRRSYFAGPEREVVVTLDRDVRYRSLMYGPSTVEVPERHIIIEVKYDRDDRTEAGAFVRKLPLTRYKNSKYVNAVEALGLASV